MIFVSWSSIYAGSNLGFCRSPLRYEHLDTPATSGRSSQEVAAYWRETKDSKDCKTHTFRKIMKNRETIKANAWSPRYLFVLLIALTIFCYLRFWAIFVLVVFSFSSHAAVVSSFVPHNTASQVSWIQNHKESQDDSRIKSFPHENMGPRTENTVGEWQPRHWRHKCKGPFFVFLWWLDFKHHVQIQMFFSDFIM